MTTDAASSEDGSRGVSDREETFPDTGVEGDITTTHPVAGQERRDGPGLDATDAANAPATQLDPDPDVIRREGGFI